MQGQSPCPRSAERGTLLCLFERRRGSKGEPSPGVPPFLYASTCAPIRWEGVVGLPCLSTPFLWCLPKETVSSRQRKALFYLGGSTIRVSAAASVDGGHLRPTWGRGLGAGLGPLRRLCGGSTVQGHGRFLLPPNTLYSRSKRQAKGFYLSPVLSYALR